MREVHGDCSAERAMLLHKEHRTRIKKVYRNWGYSYTWEYVFAVGVDDHAVVGLDKYISDEGGSVKRLNLLW